MTKKRVNTLADEVAAAVEGAKGKKPCKLCVVLQQIEPEEASIIRRALTEREPVRGRYLLGARKLYPILKRNGYEVPVVHIDTHRAEGHK